MSKIFGQDIDLNYNQAKKFRWGHQLGFPSLDASHSGFTFFNSSSKKFYGWNGTSWIDLGATGGGGGVTLEDNEFDASWDENLNGATKNSIYDKLINIVDTNNAQSISGIKTFSSRTPMSIIQMIPSAGGIVTGRQSIFVDNDERLYWSQTGSTVAARFDHSGLSQTRDYIYPDKGGTFAMISDIGSSPVTGIFTPTVVDLGSSGTFTYGSQNGNYIEIGDFVYFSIYIENINNVASSTGAITIEGIPHNPSYLTAITVGEVSGLNGNFYAVTAKLSINGAISLYTKFSLNGDYGSSPIVSQDFSGGEVLLSGCFKKD